MMDQQAVDRLRRMVIRATDWWEPQVSAEARGARRWLPEYGGEHGVRGAVAPGSASRREARVPR